MPRNFPQGIDCLRGSATFRVNLKQSKPAKHQVNRSPELYFLEEPWRRLQGPQGHMPESWAGNQSTRNIVRSKAKDARRNGHALRHHGLLKAVGSNVRLGDCAAAAH